MIRHQKDLADVSTRRVLVRRRRLVARIGDVEQGLAGLVVTRTRRCGKPDRRCADGEPHGPYAYSSPRARARGRLRYVPAASSEAVEELLAAESAVLTTVLSAQAELPDGLRADTAKGRP